MLVRVVQACHLAISPRPPSSGDQGHAFHRDLERPRPTGNVFQNSDQRHPMNAIRWRAGTPEWDTSAMSTEALEAIWRAVRTIPRGQVATYGAVARLAGLPGRARLVGHALKVAPAKLRLPWYRVVGSGPRIAFPKNTRQHAEQSRRLRAEGVTVTEGRIKRRNAGNLDEMLWKPR
jgi:methylated-DNA-protein-cysteine methyltransferase-like protein